MKEDWVKQLEQLEKKLRNKIIKDAQKQVMKPLAEAIRNVAPVDTGELKAGIKTKIGKRKTGFITTVVEIKTPDDNPHAARVELGTRDTPAQPFVRPTVAKLKEQIIEDFANAIDKGIKDAL